MIHHSERNFIHVLIFTASVVDSISSNHRYLTKPLPSSLFCTQYFRVHLFAVLVVITPPHYRNQYSIFRIQMELYLYTYGYALLNNPPSPDTPHIPLAGPAIHDGKLSIWL
ncbi:hypothetical protein K440DRAFT_248016 [Wilcoxina mikolae CBS 423.85]|nr:hypothetical protein K440DRAFT_248016 [Wilcoxina mikolae CBS 423.85]